MIILFLTGAYGNGGRKAKNCKKKRLWTLKLLKKTNITETKIQVPTDVKRVQLRSTSNIRFGKNVDSAESALSSIHKKKIVASED